MISLEERLKNLHQLPRAERLQVAEELKLNPPETLQPFVPRWWWWRRCRVNVLIVCDGGLNFGTGSFGLSEFLLTFNQLEAQSFGIDYRVTLAHRGAIINSTNPVVVNHISNFNFSTSVNLNSFDQVWLFGILPSGNISNDEVQAIETYMDGGGGLFATGDHGALGKAMCGQIKRVRDMRYWDNTDADNNLNEVSMTGKRRNDTNQPQPGNSSSTNFGDQADAIPQQIAVRTFAGGNPHYLLSIPTSIRPSGIIDIMPDHPHEGECQHEKTFSHNGMDIDSQIISFSFVVGGNTAGSKDATLPHSFPSIAVWDGRPATAGRIVVDSTWHHFVNINLNGFTNADFTVIQRYYMNIARWMSRRKVFFCWYKKLPFQLLMESQLVEACLDNPDQPLEKIKLADLKSIGALAEAELADQYSPVFARNFLVDLIEQSYPEFAKKLRIADPKARSAKMATEQVTEAYEEGWVNDDLLFHTAVGAGFIALRDNAALDREKADESALDSVEETFAAGARYGFDTAAKDFMSSVENFKRFLG